MNNTPSNTGHFKILTVQNTEILDFRLPKINFARAQYFKILTGPKPGISKYCRSPNDPKISKYSRAQISKYLRAAIIDIPNNHTQRTNAQTCKPTLQNTCGPKFQNTHGPKFQNTYGAQIPKYSLFKILTFILLKITFRWAQLFKNTRGPKFQNTRGPGLVSILKFPV